MSLTGGDSIKALLHDLVESMQHKLDKLALGQRKQFDFLIVPKDRTLEFENRYPVLEGSGVYLLAPDITPRKHDGEPEEWDKDGTIASFSAGSEVSELRRFLLTATDDKGEKRKRRGKARKEDGKKDPLPPPPPDTLARKFGPIPLKEVESGDYLTAMLKIRGQSGEYHRWATGAGDRFYWKGCPVTTRTVEGDDVGVEEFLAPLAKAFQLAREEDEAGLRNLVEAVKADTKSTDDRVEKKTVKGTSDLRRYTINVAPALARAMALLLEQGVEKEKVRDLMVAAAPLVAAEFERVTGRRTIGVSIHFDSSLPHFNVWHTGLEPVVYKVGKSERTRYRRTAMDLNASGNMLAWDRAARAFTRVGEDLAKISPATMKELEKAEKRAIQRQNRIPGDFTLNRKADELLEAAINDLGYIGLIERGFREYVDNEKKRYAAAIAGRDPKDIKKMIDLLELKDGETPLDATRRLVEEREKIEKALGDGKPGTGDIVAKVERMRTDEQKLRESLRPDDDETLADAARRMVKTVKEAGVIRSELAESRKKVRELETEIGPLRKLKATVVKFLKALMADGPKLGADLMAILKSIAELVGEKFQIKKENKDKAPEQEIQ